MPAICTVCSHLDQPAIDQAIIAGQPSSDIAERWGINPESLKRHRRNHLKAALKEAAERHGDSLQAEIEKLRKTTERIMQDCIAGDDRRGALQAIREQRENLTMIAKLRGEVDTDDRTVVEVTLGWDQQRAAS